MIFIYNQNLDLQDLLIASFCVTYDEKISSFKKIITWNSN